MTHRIEYTYIIAFCTTGPRLYCCLLAMLHMIVRLHAHIVKLHQVSKTECLVDCQGACMEAICNLSTCKMPLYCCCQGCARLLLRCARRADTDFPAHAAELTAEAVAACARAGMRSSAFELAANALRAPLTTEMTPAQRRRLEAVVRRRDMCVIRGCASLPCTLVEQGVQAGGAMMMPGRVSCCVSYALDKCTEHTAESNNGWGL